MYKKAGALIVVLLTLGLLFVSIPQAKANPQFALASWEEYDEYGQGIYQFNIYENSKGSWVQVGGNERYYETSTFDWNASLFIKLISWTHFNNTLVGAINEADGQNYQLHNVTVTNARTTVFSQENFTYVTVQDIGFPLWTYAYEVVLNFIPEQGQIYTVTVTYEVFY